MQNYFTLLDMPQSFTLDLATLEDHYRQLQAQVHPDKFVTATPAERMQSMQTATTANEAFQTLKHPTSRARYLLSLQGIETDEESNTAMPADFLMTQMEWREAIEDAKHANDIDALDKQLHTMRKTAKALQETLGEQLDKAPAQAAETVRKLTFIDKVSDDVNNIISQLDD